jgi:hypothetical protein
LVTALSTVDKVCAPGNIDQKVAAACGELASAIYRSGSDRKADEGVASLKLAQRAYEYLDMAVTQNKDDLASWYGMAILLSAANDLGYTRAFLPRMQRTVSAHLNNGQLAEAMMHLCESAGETRMALNYADVWQRRALTSAARDEATVSISRFQAALDRTKIEAGVAPH